MPVRKEIKFAVLMSLVTKFFGNFVLISVNIGFTNNFILVWMRSWFIAFLLVGFSLLFVAQLIIQFSFMRPDWYLKLH